ncbi:MAG: beta-1,6-N-acetylglucosaminyltransferase [Muribaculaceae bacterium]|nr:beta-1,6-N-acetylglucosaminyltransferase [Muribaculaceae bacterium]
MFNLCYLIFAHNNISFLAETIKMLKGEGISFYIHIDVKCNEDISPLKKLNSVNIIDDRFDIKWGGYAMIDALLHLCSAALADPQHFDYFIFLSGECVPLKSSGYIKEYILNHNLENFIKAMPIPSEDCKWLEHGKRRLTSYPVFLPTRNIAMIEPRKLNYANLRQIGKTLLNGDSKTILEMLKIWLFNPKRKSFPFQAYGGDFWWRMNRKSLETVISNYNDSLEFQIQMKQSPNPDEIAFVTLAYNFCSDINNSILTYVNWKGERSPERLTIKDSSLLLNLIKDPDTLFCRKINDSQVLDFIKVNLQEK